MSSAVSKSLLLAFLSPFLVISGDEVSLFSTDCTAAAAAALA